MKLKYNSRHVDLPQLIDQEYSLILSYYQPSNYLSERIIITVSLSNHHFQMLKQN